MPPSWAEVSAQHYRFTTAACEHRYRLIGDFFYALAPWLEKSLNEISLRHFLVLPKELLLANMFGKIARRETFHASYAQFSQWLEANILADLSNPANDLGTPRCTYGKPDLRLQFHFNQMPHCDRSILYCFMVESMSYYHIAEHLSLTVQEAQNGVYLAWSKLLTACPHVRIPRDWQVPSELSLPEISEAFHA